MISVADAHHILSQVAPLDDTETIALSAAADRILVAPIIAKRTQPPRDVSAMDGYAIDFADIENGTESFAIIGEVAAGSLFDGTLKSGEAVRIFTGASLPDGANHIVIQEDVTRAQDTITLTCRQDAPRHVRKAGQDFCAGDVLLGAGRRLSAADLALVANGNHGTIDVTRRPRIAFVSSGDEIVAAGTADSDTQIPDCNSAALQALVHDWGGECVARIITPDDKPQFTAAVKALPAADIIVPIGGASVGDYDYAKQVFYDLGYQAIFEKIAVKPGKPCWFADNHENLVLGLPGNPSSALVTAHLFLRPLIARLAGLEKTTDMLSGVLSAHLPANGGRENYLRGVWQINDAGQAEVEVAAKQDSALTGTFAAANCLVQCLPDAPERAAGDRVKFIAL